VSGGQTPRLDSDKELKYMSNLMLGTACPNHMPYVVAYVVADVVVSGVECLLSPVADMAHCTRLATIARGFTWMAYVVGDVERTARSCFSR
jgi:hypothetical protein